MSLAPRGLSSLRWNKVITSVSKTVSLLSFSASIICPVFAGSSPSGAHAVSVNIADSNGGSWALDLSSILTYDAATGNIQMPATGTPVSGNWSWTTVDVLNAQTGQLEKRDGLNWHTDERNEDNSAWRSIITFYGKGNVDPFLSYGFSARNTTAVTQTYTFSYGESIVPPISGNYTIYADIAGSLTNGVAGTSAQIAPTYGDLDGDGIPEIQTLKLSTNGGATFFNGGVDVGPQLTSGPAAGTSIYGLYSSNNSGNTAPVDYWQFDVQFTLTPGRDAAAISGYAELNAVAIPEASTTAVLFSSGVLGFALIRRKKVAFTAF